MFITKNHPVFLTLFLLIVTVFVLAPTANATSYASGGVSRRRDHATLKRFVKKRAVFPAASSTPSSDSNLAGLSIGAAPDPADTAPDNTTSSSTTTSLTSTSTTDTATVTSSTNTTSISTDSTTTTTSGNGTSTTSSSSSSTTTSSTSSQTSATSTTSSAVEPPATPSSTQVTLTRTETAQQAAQTSVTPSEGSGGLNSSGKTALVTILIVVAASVGGFAILWTVFRKWKLGRSKKFDQRLQPISWEPTVDDDVVPHRPGSDSASIRSDNRSGYGATSNLSHGLDHDFTAGPAHLAPVGGYADLTRGPSPQPSMQEALSRGPSLTRPNYDASVPLHHQNNYGVQDTYGRY